MKLTPFCIVVINRKKYQAKIADIVCQSYETLDVIIGSRNASFLDPIVLVRMNSLIVYHMAKTFYALGI